METLKFDIGILNTDGISDTDLNPPKRLSKEGVYTFNVVKVELNPIKKDGTNQKTLVDSKGSRFQPMKVTLETEVDSQMYTLEERFFVPVEGSLNYQKEGGKPTLCFTQPLKKFIESLTNTPLSNTDELLAAIKNLGNLLAQDNITVTGKVGFKSKDRINKIADDRFEIIVADGSTLENDEGEVVWADSPKGIVEAYNTVLGRQYESGVEVKAFFINKEV